MATFIIVSVGAFVFWIMMLIDCIHRDFDKKTLWILLLLFLGLPATIAYYFIVKKKGGSVKEMAASASAVAATTFVAAEEAITPVSPITVTPPAPAASNVTVSTVEEIHGTPPEKTLTENQTSLAGENSPLTSPEESDTDTSIPQTMSEEAESMIATPPVEVFEAIQETPATPINEALPTDQEKEPSAVLVENPAPETPFIETPMADIFLTPSAPTETTTVTPNEIVEKTPSQPSEAHPLFEGMFDSVEPKTETLGNNTTNNK